MKVQIMETRGASRSDGFIVFLLFVGFGGVVGWLATALFGLYGLPSLGFLVFAVVGLPWGIILLRRSERKGRLVVWSLVPAVLASPVYVAIGIVMVFAKPHVHAMISGAQIVRSVSSPDGQFEAYIEDRPCIDPPNQFLYIQRQDRLRFLLVAHLPQDIDANQEIRWSPHGDIVVFCNRYSLIAVRVPGYQTVKIPLYAEWRRTKPRIQSTFSLGGPTRQVTAVEFPGTGTFRYRLDGTDEFREIRMDTL